MTGSRIDVPSVPRPVTARRPHTAWVKAQLLLSPRTASCRPATWEVGGRVSSRSAPRAMFVSAPLRRPTVSPAAHRDLDAFTIGSQSTSLACRNTDGACGHGRSLDFLPAHHTQLPLRLSDDAVVTSGCAYPSEVGSSPGFPARFRVFDPFDMKPPQLKAAACILPMVGEGRSRTAAPELTHGRLRDRVDTSSPS